jgi:hypothetical protein
MIGLLQRGEPPQGLQSWGHPLALGNSLSHESEAVRLRGDEAPHSAADGGGGIALGLRGGRTPPRRMEGIQLRPAGALVARAAASRSDLRAKSPGNPSVACFFHCPTCRGWIANSPAICPWVLSSRKAAGATFALNSALCLRLFGRSFSAMSVLAFYTDALVGFLGSTSTSRYARRSGRAIQGCVLGN